ncbi:hypothetical protein CEXT_699951 [Caerostris extrusa]|uniref:Uncharacterized protein n=1 Tax=Caerostris extrusa TaxID=172846 RepID=A0AAV4UJE7_CAEEX|nr:hypothetical protein CEXT_699951 [Caerostris extrusa]
MQSVIRPELIPLRVEENKTLVARAEPSGARVNCFRVARLLTSLSGFPWGRGFKVTSTLPLHLPLSPTPPGSTATGAHASLHPPLLQHR